MGKIEHEKLVNLLTTIEEDTWVRWVGELPKDRNFSWFVDFAREHIRLDQGRVEIDHRGMGLMTLSDFFSMPRRPFPYPWNDLAFAVHTHPDPDASEAFVAFIDLVTRAEHYYPLKHRPYATIKTHPLVGLTLKKSNLEPQIRRYSVDDWATWSTTQPFIFPLVNLPLKINES